MFESAEFFCVCMFVASRLQCYVVAGSSKKQQEISSSSSTASPAASSRAMVLGHAGRGRSVLVVSFRGLSVLYA